MYRFNVVFRKYLLLWALLAMVVGYLAGKYNQSRVSSLAFLLTPLAFVMMIIMVIPSTLASLVRARTYIYPMIASFSLLVLSPFMAYVVSSIVPESLHYLRTGIIVASTMPSNAMLSAWTAFLEGDVLLTFIIQSFSSLVGLFFMPFGTRMLFTGAGSVSLFLLLRNLFFLIVIPFAIGTSARKLFRRRLTEKLMRKMKPTLSSISSIIELFIILIIVGLRAQDISVFPVLILWGVLASALFHIASFIIALYFVKLFRFGFESAVPLVFQNGTKNLSVAMVIAVTSFGSQAVLGVAACILTQFPVSAFFYSLISRDRILLKSRDAGERAGELPR